MPGSSSPPQPVKPHVSAGLLIGIAASVASVTLAGLAVAAPYQQPSEPLVVTVDERLETPGVIAGGELPFTVSQAHVDAVVDAHELLTHEPISVHFSADPAPEELDSTLPVDMNPYSPEADVTIYIGSEVWGEANAATPYETVAVTDDAAQGITSAGFDFRNTTAEVLQRAISNGQGPAALATTAHTAATLASPAPSSAVWLSSALASLAVAYFGFYRWYRQRRRREAEQRRFAAARSELATQIVELDTLEISSLTAPGATSETWNHFQNELWRLQQEEADLVPRLASTRPISQHPEDPVRQRLETFLTDCAGLANAAQKVEMALAVSADRANASRELEKFLGPIFTAVIELRTQLEDHPELNQQREQLHSAHRRLLSLSENIDAPTVTLVDVEQALAELDQARKQAQNSVDQAHGDSGGQHPERSGRRRRRPVKKWLAGGVALVLLVLIGQGAGHFAADQLEGFVPAWERDYTAGSAGENQVNQIVLDDPHGLAGDIPAVSEEAIRHHLKVGFSTPIDLVIAVRDLDNLGEFGDTTQLDSDADVQFEYARVLGSVWDIKAELAETGVSVKGNPVVDPLTGEITPPSVVVPVFVGEQGVMTLSPVTGILPSGQNTVKGGLSYNVTNWLRDADQDWLLSLELESFAQQFGTNAEFYDQTSPVQLSRAVTGSVILLGAVGLQLLSWLGSISAGVGRWSAQSGRLRQAQKIVDRLFLQEEDRDFAMVLANTDADDAAHRLTHHMIIQCARELDELKLTQREARTSAEFAERVDALLSRLDALSAQHQRSSAEHEEEPPVRT